MESEGWSEPFIFQDGTLVKDLPSLLHKLQSIDDQTFSHYVNESKNDFAIWITNALHITKLGFFAHNIRSRIVMISALHDYLNDIEKQKASMSPPPQPIHTQERIIPEIVKVEEKVISDNGAVSSVTTPKEEASSPETQEKPRISTVIPTKSSTDPLNINEEPEEDFKPVATQEETKAPLEEKAPAQKQQMGAFTASMDNQIVIDKLEDEGVVSEAEVQEFAQHLQAMQGEVSKIFIGQKETVHMAVLALICEAHLLLEGVPGLAKSVLVETLAKTLKGSVFKRIQFIPDLLPSDVIGGQIYNPKTGEFKVVKGPIFANFVLADEVNRAPPKTHAALMEAMAERKINIDKEEFILDRPFMVMATQNPLENKGTYQLPEAVMDRFMFKVDMPYPSRSDEKIIITENNTTKSELRATVKPVVDKAKMMEMQHKVRTIHLSNRIKEYILNIVEATRGHNKAIQGIKFVQYGAGPRASIALGIGAKAQAMLEGRNYVLPKDINAVSKAILRHRVTLNFKGKAYKITSDRIVEEILEKVVEM